jgi:acyl-CoA synthetase (AMP-forming)/AMP-acid ligase II
MSSGVHNVFGDVAKDLAARYPDKPALISESGELTFRAANDRMSRFANALMALGIAPGERIAVLSRNRNEILECYGATKAGIIVVPLNWRLSEEELLHPLLDCQPAAVIADAQFAPVIDRLRAKVLSARQWIAFDAPREGWLAYDELLANAASSEPGISVHANDILSIMYTSGTTGKPKGAMLSHGGLMRNGAFTADRMIGLRDSDVALAVMPLFHVGGLWYHLFPAYYRGCSTVLLPEFSPKAVLSAMQAKGVTYVHLVPTMINALINDPDIHSFDLSRLRILYYAASSIPVETLRKAMETFPQCQFFQGYGSTEAGAVTTLMPADHRAVGASTELSGKLATAGRALDCEIRVLDPDKTGIGEIAVRSDRTMAGYWRNPEATGAVFDHGWLRTGDLGSIDPDGYLTIADRKNDMIVSGGENVYPREVEDALHEDPEILEAAVFGLPDPHWVEKVVAAIVLRQGARMSADDLKRRFHGRLAGYKFPKDVYFVESLPKNGAGKVLKKELRRTYGPMAG